MYNLIFGPALFYDLPEYLQIVSTHSFWQSILLGHFPIHPVFMAILWPLIKIVPVNVIAMLFGIASIFIISKISKKAAIIYALFPAIWIINTNLMVESVLLFFYILATYFYLKEKRFWFLISIFLLVGTHLEGLFWIPAIFIVPLILNKKTDFKKFIKPAIFAIILSLATYLLLYKISGLGFGGSSEQLSTYFSSGILRMSRNVWLSLATSYGSLTVFILGYLVIRNAKSKPEKIGWIALGILVVIIAANWQGDFMARRVAFSALPFSLAMTKYLKKWRWIFVLYLLPILIANIILYAKGSPFTDFQIPKNEVLIQTHYLKPFTKYDGTILWIGESDLGLIDKYLTSGKRVFLTEDAVTAPYRLLVGNNYHITSLSRVGDSESRFLFEKYKVAKYNNVLELKSFKGRVSPDAGKPIVYYGTDLWSRLSRRRIDYGDIGTWVWVIITNHRDPITWIYTDVTGSSYLHP